MSNKAKQFGKLLQQGIGCIAAYQTTQGQKYTCTRVQADLAQLCQVSEEGIKYWCKGNIPTPDQFFLYQARHLYHMVKAIELNRYRPRHCPHIHLHISPPVYPQTFLLIDGHTMLFAGTKYHNHEDYMQLIQDDNPQGIPLGWKKAFEQLRLGREVKITSVHRQDLAAFPHIEQLLGEMLASEFTALFQDLFAEPHYAAETVALLERMLTLKEFEPNLAEILKPCGSLPIPLGADTPLGRWWQRKGLPNP